MIVTRFVSVLSVASTAVPSENLPVAVEPDTESVADRHVQSDEITLGSVCSTREDSRAATTYLSEQL